MIYKSALFTATITVSFSLFPGSLPAQPLCAPPCYLDMYKPCPNCQVATRCSCPPKRGVSAGSGSRGKAEIHRKNVPQVRKNKSPPYD
jgi:hypothetical protein